MDLKPFPDTATAGRLIFTPNPVTLDGQRNVAAELQSGETLARFLARTVPVEMGHGWEVRINGVVVPHEVMRRVRPKPGTVIEVRSVANKQALHIVAMAALTYFTFGAGATWFTGKAAAWVYAGTFIAGSMLINKVLGPKLGKPMDSGRDSVYSISGARNQARPYQPMPLLFGKVRIAPDVIGAPYTWFEGNDMYMGMALTPGLNVHRFEPLQNGDTPLASFEGVKVNQAGFSGMPQQSIPLFSNADTVNGGELHRPDGGGVRWVERATPADTVRVMVNLEYILGDQTSKGKPYANHETVVVEYRRSGQSQWAALVTQQFSSSDFNTKRATLKADLPKGQYDIRVCRQGRARYEGHAQVQFQFTNMVCVQADGTDYTDIPRIAVSIKATGQLNNAPDELRCVAVSNACPVWDGQKWVTRETSNPGAHMLQYVRGIKGASGRLLAGMGLQEAMIDIEAFKGFMLHCEANGYTYDHWVSEPRSHDEMLAALALVGMGQYTWAGGKLSVVWAAREQPLSGVVNMATIKRASFQVDYTLTNAADGVDYSYYDAEARDTGIVRVVQPGANMALNPATISGEGVTRAAHAAELARWHMAQSLYQYKAISYGADLEHLSYRRMDLLALQHDLTQWGYGGRVMAATRNGGAVMLTLDEAVPAPATGNAYIGLRIPGERVYRVFAVQRFTGESDTLTLAEPWPPDAAFPGEGAGNLPHDTIWVYDFKQTPGYRVRVVGIQPEPGLKGATVSVVPESPEFWDYVKTGNYQRPQNQSLLPPRPVVETLRISEAQITQGDTVYTELQADWTASGKASYFTVHASRQVAGRWEELGQVAETRSNTARFRIHEAGTYRVTVRPYNADGVVGGIRTASYGTRGVDMAPPRFDHASVEPRDGGLRVYCFGYSTTMQPGNYAGAEIRYMQGSHAAPNWSAMTPLGGDGFFTADTEAAVPASGTWTVAFRPRNTDGLLGEAFVVPVQLGASIGQQIGSIGSTIEQHTQQLVHAQQERDRIAAESVQRDAKGALDAAADATAKANLARDAAYLRAQTLMNQAIATAAADATIKADGARDVALARINTVEAQVADILSADAHSTSKSYPAGDLVQAGGKLYRAKRAVPTGIAITNATYWEYVGDYKSLGEAVAASLSEVKQTQTALGIERQRINGVVSRMPGGTDGLATQAMVLEETTERLSADEALAGRATALEARAGNAESNIGVALSRIAAEETARAGADNALASRTTALEARMPAGSGKVASEARVNEAQQAAANANTATASRVTALETRVNDGSSGLARAHAHIAEVSDASVSRDNALASRATALEARMPQLATSASVTEYNNASVSRDNALGERITNVDAKANAAQAAATQAQTAIANEVAARAQAITAVEAKLGGAASGNLLTNSEMLDGVGNWALTWNQGNSVHHWGRNYGGDQFAPQDGYCIGQHIQGVEPAGQYTVLADGWIRVAPGVRYCASAYLSALHCDAAVGIRFANASKQTVSEYREWVPSRHSVDNASLKNWQRAHVFFTAPADSMWVRLEFWIRGKGIRNPYAWLTRPMLCEVAEGVTVPPLYAPGGNEHARAVFDMRTEIDAAKNERRAIAGLYVTANGKIGGFKTISDGITSRFDITADIFSVTSDAAQGLEWQAGCLRSYSGTSQAVIGSGFGESGDLALYIGPNTGRAAARKRDAALWADVSGNAGFSGVVYGSVISGSALSLESLRIRVDGGQYAPFTICDTASDFVNHTAGTRVMTSTCSGFVAPGNGTGYHHKRFARQRQDVQMQVNLHTDHGWEDVVLEVQYNGGGWQQIASTSIDGGYRNSATYLVRYTTLNDWQTVAFRARTVRGKTTCLTLRVDIANYNESGNPPGSNSSMFSPGGTGGQAPAPPPAPPRAPAPPGDWQLEQLE